MVATSLAGITLASISGVLSSALAGRMNWRVGLPFAAGAMVGMRGGRLVASRLSDPRLQQGLAPVAGYLCHRRAGLAMPGAQLRAKLLLHLLPCVANPPSTRLPAAREQPIMTMTTAAASAISLAPYRSRRIGAWPLALHMGIRTI